MIKKKPPDECEGIFLNPNSAYELARTRVVGKLCIEVVICLRKVKNVKDLG
jgi:hypothetical protein